jgi:hypothetical protein
MSRIEINSSLGLGLDRLCGPAWVFDEHGRKLGQFVPCVDAAESCPIPEAELQRRAAFALANPEAGKPLAEILSRLEKQ